jgi:Mn2+/Fe2+ NRAMP family transporter
MAVWKVMRNKVKVYLKKVGPGFITGAADDDPSGVATYSIAGAQYGYRMSWMSLFLLPAMISIQEMCGRIGLVTGRGWPDQKDLFS